MIETGKIYTENCLETFKGMPDDLVDMTITSPPYDDLRDYNGFNLEPSLMFKFSPRLRAGVSLVLWEKFFNLEERPETALPALPPGPFEVFEKVDGSLGILYHAGDGPALASRGSFTSDQALRGTRLALAPFNLLIGPNGSGKTSLIEALLQLRTLAHLPVAEGAAPVGKARSPAIQFHFQPPHDAIVARLGCS